VPLIFAILEDSGFSLRVFLWHQLNAIDSRLLAMLLWWMGLCCQCVCVVDGFVAVLHPLCIDLCGAGKCNSTRAGVLTYLLALKQRTIANP
jgi:hypothetical protein